MSPTMTRSAGGAALTMATVAILAIAGCSQGAPGSDSAEGNLSIVASKPIDEKGAEVSVAAVAAGRAIGALRRPVGAVSTRAAGSAVTAVTADTIRAFG